MGGGYGQSVSETKPDIFIRSIEFHSQIVLSKECGHLQGQKGKGKG